MTTIEGNKLIAEFMPELRVFNGVDYIPVSDWSNLKSLQFNSSWDWLMPVVEKIEDYDFIVIIKQGECIIINNSGETPKFIQELCETKIKSVWLAVVEFIKWYNENK